jgi:hypothetical protein
MAILGTTALRRAWDPHCKHKWEMRPAYEALDACLKHWGYKPGAGTGAANCRQITPPASGWSLHAFFAKLGSFKFWNGFKMGAMALAVDINPSQNPFGKTLITDMHPGMIRDICAVRTNSGHQVWQWGGFFKPYHDAMHDQICCTPDQLATGIDASTLPGAKPAPTPQPTPEQPAQNQEDLVMIFAITDLDRSFVVMPDGLVRITKAEFWALSGGGMKVIPMTDALFKKLYEGKRVKSFNDDPVME